MGDSLLHRTIILIGLLTLVIAGCGSDSGQETSDPSSPTEQVDPDTTTDETEPIRVGAVLALSGAGAGFGGPERQGIELALSEINAAGGVAGRPLEVEITDDQTNSEQSAVIARDYISKGYQAVFGPTIGVTSIDQLLRNAGVLQITPTGAGNPGEEEFLTKFHVTAPQPLNAEATLDLVDKAIGASSIYVFHGSDPFGQIGGELLPATAPDFGIEVLGTDSFDPDQSDLSPLWVKARNTGAESVAIWGFGPATVNALINRQDLEIDTPVVGSIGLAFPGVAEAAGEAAEDLYVPAFLAANDPRPYQEDFVAAFSDEYGELPTVGAQWGYDGVYLIAAAYEEAGPDATGEELAQALEGSTIQGVTAEFEFTAEDHTGIGLSDYVYVVVRDGEFIQADVQP